VIRKAVGPQTVGSDKPVGHRMYLGSLKPCSKRPPLCVSMMLVLTSFQVELDMKGKSQSELTKDQRQK